MTMLAELINQAGTPRTLGRPPKELVHSFERELSAEDMLVLAKARGSKTPKIKEIRQYHHTVARLLAQGMKDVQVSQIAGMSVSRISILKDDPSFQELLEYYSSMEAAAYSQARVDVHEKLGAIGADSLEVLHERLIDSPEKIEDKTLIALAEMALDRTGYGKSSTVNQNVTSISLDAAELARIRASSDANQGPARPLSEESRGALVRIAQRTALLHSPAEEAAGDAGAGPGVREEGGTGTGEDVPQPEVPPVDQVRGS